MTRIGEVLESFRDFASSSQLDLHAVDLRQLVDRAIRLVHPHAARQGIVLTSIGPEDGLICVEADATRLEQVLLNLLLNAEEAMHGGAVTVRLSSDLGYAIIEVADTGPGIPENILPRVFDPYFSTKPQGSGMGLAICQKIIQQHGGSIACDTGSDGTVFRIRIPLMAAPNGRQSISQASDQAAALGSHKVI
jgi:signal transduction histidine kinase